MTWSRHRGQTGRRRSTSIETTAELGLLSRKSLPLQVQVRLLGNMEGGLGAEYLTHVVVQGYHVG